MVVDGIIRLCTLMPSCGIFVGDDGGGLLPEFEMLVLDDAGEGHVGRRVVDHRIALEIGRVEPTSVETQAAVFQWSESVVKVLVDAPGIYHTLRQGIELGTVGKIVGVEPKVDAIEQTVDEHIVSAHGDALIRVVEIVVVERETQGHTLDDFGGQQAGLPAPLFLGIALDKGLVDVAAAEFQCLLLKVGWGGDMGICRPLLRQFALSLGRRAHPP